LRALERRALDLGLLELALELVDARARLDEPLRLRRHLLLLGVELEELAHRDAVLDDDLGDLDDAPCSPAGGRRLALPRRQAEQLVLVLAQEVVAQVRGAQAIAAAR
jgi:hypothetical protein